MKLFKEINIPIELNQKYIIPELTENYRILTYRNFSSILSNRTIDLLFNLSCEVKEVQLFSGSPKNIFAIHIDGHIEKTNVPTGALNFVISKSNHWIMQWFTTTESLDKKVIFNDNVPYTSLNTENCKLITSYKSSNPFLVRVDIPHRVVNFSTIVRHCISIRFKNNNFDRLLNIL